MKFLDRNKNSPESEARIAELTERLAEAERKLAERELLLAEAFDQTETTRAQYEQANVRAETLRRHLTAKEQQVSALQDQLKQRNDQIMLLERMSTLIEDAARDAKQPTVPIAPSASLSVDTLGALGLALESLDQPGTLYRITRASTTLGRTATNDVAIQSTSVSRFHARIEVEADGVFLIDLESTNGCKVNGQRITRQRLGNADEIWIGKTKFRFSIGVPAHDADARGMQETHVLLNDSAIFIAAPTVKPSKTQ